MSTPANAQQSTTPPPAAGVGPTGNALVVLLVDDDPDCRLLTRDAIVQACPGAVVHEAATADQAFCFLRKDWPYEGTPRPSLIYLDVEMPGMNGVEFVAAIKLNTSLSDIPVVMMTGVSDEQRINAAATCGANSYIIKPCDALAFSNIVSETTRYWLTVHQCPSRHLPANQCRR